MTLWEIFCSSGKVDDYLSYRRETDTTYKTDKTEKKEESYASYSNGSGSP